MAISTNEILKEASGKFGDVLIRQIDGKTILSPMPEKTGKPGSPQQQAIRQRFGEGTETIRRLFRQQPELKAYYQAKAGPHRKAFNVAMSDWLNGRFTATPPALPAVPINKEVPVSIQLPEGLEICSMQLSVKDKDGRIIEVRPVFDSKKGIWVYMPAAEPVIEQAAMPMDATLVALPAVPQPKKTATIAQKKGRTGQQKPGTPTTGTVSLLPVYKDQREPGALFSQTTLPIFTSTLSVGSPYDQRSISAGSVHGTGLGVAFGWAQSYFSMGFKVLKVPRSRGSE